jgi:hypothetical protein
MPFPTSVDPIVDGPPTSANTTIFASQVKGPQRITVGPTWLNILSDLYSGGADPSGVADSTAAIQAAITALPAGGGRIYMPPGTYKLTSSLTVSTSNVLIEGSGFSTILSCATNTFAALLFAQVNRCIVRDLKIDAPDSGVKFGTAGTGCIDCLAENIWVNNFKTDGAGCYFQTSHSTIRRCLFDGSSASQHGAVVSGGAGPSNHNTIERCRANAIGTLNANGLGFAVDGGCTGTMFLGNRVVTTGLDGIRIAEDQPAQASKFTLRSICIGNYVEAAGQSAIDAIVPGGSTGTHQMMTLVGNTVFGPQAGRGIFFQKISKGVIEANVIDMNSQNSAGIEIDVNSDTIAIEGNTISNTTSPLVINAAPSTVRHKNNIGTQPQGVAAITVTASPFTYTNADNVPEAVYIDGGTITTVVKNAITLYSFGGTAARCGVWLEPGEAVTVTYTGAPTMNKDRK